MQHVADQRHPAIRLNVSELEKSALFLLGHCLFLLFANSIYHYMLVSGAVLQTVVAVLDCTCVQFNFGIVVFVVAVMVMMSVAVFVFVIVTVLVLVVVADERLNHPQYEDSFFYFKLNINVILRIDH